MENIQKPKDSGTIDAILADFYKLCERYHKGSAFLDSGQATEADAYRFNFEILNPINKYMIAFLEWGVKFDSKKAFSGMYTGV